MRVGRVHERTCNPLDTHFVSFVSNTRVVGYDASWLDLFQNTNRFVVVFTDQYCREPRNQAWVCSQDIDVLVTTLLEAFRQFEVNIRFSHITQVQVFHIRDQHRHGWLLVHLRVLW